MSRVVFLDRDGTVNEEMGYINHPDRLVVFPEAVKAIKLLNDNNIPAILVSNQAGLARGYFDETVLFKTHRKMLREIKSRGGHLDLTIYCPFLPGAPVKKYARDHKCRKPSTGMLDLAGKIIPFSPADSYMIGDRHKDMGFARAGGLHPLLVRTGYGKGELELGGFPAETLPEKVFDNILEAVEWIISQK